MQNHISTKVDMHFHTKLSGWEKDDNYILSLAKDKWIKTVVATDKDIINKDFYNKANRIGLITCYWVEITVVWHKWEKIQILAYMKEVSQELELILDKSRKEANKWDRYLPRLRDLKIAFEWSNSVLSLADPSKVFPYTWEFKNNIDMYIHNWINAIEINSLTSKSWVHTILHTTKDSWLYTTFWSNSYLESHWDFWETNHYLDIPIIRREIKKLRKVLF